MKKKLLTLIFAIIAMFAFSLSAMAEETQADLYNNEKIQDIVISITYEHNDLTFCVISPSGQIYTKDTVADNVSVSAGEKATIIAIKQAEAGQWKIKYDKGSNESFKVSVGTLDSQFMIQNFTKGQIVNNEMPVEFNVSGVSGQSYDYKIYLTTDNKSMDGKELYSGSSTIGENVSIMIPFSEISSHQEYYLMLMVSMNKDGHELFDRSYTEKFEFVNENAPEPLENVNVTIYHDSKQVTLDWGEYVSYSCESVFIEYYIGDVLQNGEEITSEDGNYSNFIYENENEKLKFKIYVKYNGLVSSAYELVVDTKESNGVAFTFPESGLVYSNIWNMEYEDADKTFVKIEINDDDYEYELDGDGSKFFDLKETNNTITITYTDTKNIKHVYEKIANVSIVTPTLQLLNNIDGVVTENDFIIISGKSNATEILINDTKVAVEDGIFAYKYPLSAGKNEITLSATIGEKNTEMKATVVMETAKEDATVADSEDEDNKKGFPMWIIYLGAGLLISVIGIVVLFKLSGKKNSTTKPENVKQTKQAKTAKKISLTKILLTIAIVIEALLAAISTYLWIVYNKRTKFENSSEYIDLAYNSLKEASEYLEKTKSIFEVALIFTIVTGALLVLAILFLVIIKVIKNKNKKQLERMQAPLQLPPEMMGMQPIQPMQPTQPMQSTQPPVNDETK